MQKLLYILFFLLSACALIFISCHDTIDDFFNDSLKNEYVNYLHNETAQDVTVIFSHGAEEMAEHSYIVPKGGMIEIPNQERLSVSLRALECDSVVFLFADGTRVVHTYTNTTFGQDTYHFIYEPAENNIFYTGYDIPSEQDAWVYTSLGTLKFRFDYTIK